VHLCERCQAPGIWGQLGGVYDTSICERCSQALQRWMDGHPTFDAYTQAEAMVQYWLVQAVRHDVLAQYQAALRHRNTCGTALKRVIWAWLATPPPEEMP